MKVGPTRAPANDDERQRAQERRHAAIVRTATAEALCDVAERIRAEDRAEIDCQVEGWTPELLARAALAGPALVAWLGDRPHAAFGATEHAGGVWVAWCWGTDRIRRCAPAIVDYAQHVLRPSIVAAGARRIEARALAGNGLGFKLLRRLGASQRARLHGHGRQGQDFVLFEWETPQCASTSSHPN